MNNMEIYEKVRKCPDNALKKIQGGATERQVRH